jgi:penicillin G amidase
MKPMKPYMRWGLAGLALVVAIGAAGWFWLRSSLPQLDGTVALDGIGQSVTVYRDTVGVPHVMAQTQADAAYALGYVHAQDRLWQMEFNRRLGAGRLAEVLGAPALRTDRLMRTYGFYALAKADFQGFDAASKARYSAYAAGVNAYLDSHRGALPPEFLLLGVKPEPWQPADSLVWLKLMALDMGYMWRRELERLQLAATLSPQQSAELLDKTTGPVPSQLDLKTLLAELPPSAFALPAVKEGTGSNSWVLAGSRTASGKPLLANDPHINFSQPSAWYLAHLAVGDRNVVGVTFPGLPFVVLGRNDQLAWGFTNVAPDVHDLVVERLDLQAGTYATADGPMKWTERRETIQVKGAAPVVITVRTTRNGPFLSDAMPEVAKALGPGHALALRWTMLDPGDQTGAAALRLNDATTVDAFVAALRQFVGPMQNIVYADRAGTIGYVTPGHLPLRDADYPGRGLTPAPGWLASTRWLGMTPFEALIQQRNPPEGYFVTANSRITNAAFPNHVTFDWEASFRHDRIIKRILAKPKHDINTMRAIQADPVDEALGEAARRLAALVPERPMAQGLLAWNGIMDAGKREPLLAFEWVQAFSKRLTRDELRSGAPEALSDYRIALVLRALRGMDRTTRWCDDVTTAGVQEACGIMADRALADALESLESRFGPDRKAWRWGDSQRVAFEHHPFSQVPALKRFFARTIEVGGGVDAINSLRPRLSGPEIHSVYLGPSFRGIYDLSNLEQSRFMIPTGQSGNPLSPWYDNLSEPWAQSKDFSIPTDPKVLATRMAHRLILTPAPR